MRFICSPSIIRAIYVGVFEKSPKLPKLEVKKLATAKKLSFLELTQIAIIFLVISKYPNRENDMTDKRRKGFKMKPGSVGRGRHHTSSTVPATCKKLSQYRFSLPNRALSHQDVPYRIVSMEKKLH